MDEPLNHRLIISISCMRRREQRERDKAVVSIASIQKHQEVWTFPKVKLSLE
jgi:hypothetical protein